jgi:hypothetical protein
MSKHFIEKCKWCGVVISQCRCADLNKPVRFSICGECQSKPPDIEHLKKLNVINGIYPVCEPDEPKAGDIILPADSFEAYIMGVNEGVERCEMAARGFLFDWFDSSKVAEQQLFYKGLMLVLAACKVKI